MLLPERDCTCCTQQEEWGCGAHLAVDDAGEEVWVGAAAVPVEIDGEEVWRCPRRPILDDPSGWDRLLFYYRLYDKGHLPDSGAVTDQGHRAMQLMALVDRTVQTCRDELDERNRQRAARSGGEP
jgi:hypothetical protein